MTLAELFTILNSKFTLLRALTMPEDFVINTDALQPLFSAWEKPTTHRIKGKKGGPASQVKGRRRSSITIAQHLRAHLSDWREADYPGASETSRHLLDYWFHRSHRLTNFEGDSLEFRYYFCQREATETLIYLKEVKHLDTLSQLVNEYGGANREKEALGINPSEDQWPRYAFKLATGTGKTKCMSLAIVWSYFHALRETDSPMARNFVLIAPNLTVFERLKEDFKPADGGPSIFEQDPLIPTEWKGDWNLSVVLQDETSGAASSGTLYLTNIHRLYDPSKRRTTKEAAIYDWMGPIVSKPTALDTGRALRQRATSHDRIMVLNDEAHHVWDPDSAWNQSIEQLEKGLRSSGGQLIGQLDYSATPKDNKGLLFKHVVVDTPLGEAVDAGIVKCPIIGDAGQLNEEADDNAAYRYHQHLMVGYQRWQKSYEEWRKSGKKALLFVMCEDTTAADQIARRLNTDPYFAQLNDKTINLHTNLKGKIKSKGRGNNKRAEFVESEKQISDEDLQALHKLSRELDSDSSPYLCIVSVLMLREGWDVRNVTTIVPLRPYSSKANILPEQTLGRGLRRMMPPGEADEVVVVVEHEAFARLSADELSQEGNPIEIVDVDKIPKTTVSIFPDASKANFKELDIPIPQLRPAHRILPKLEGLDFQQINDRFKQLKLTPLPLGEASQKTIDYEGRQLITNEVVEIMEADVSLLQNGFTALTYFRKAFEHTCKVKNTHALLAPLLKQCIEKLLFVEKTTLSDERLKPRLSDQDVHEYLRAIFIPLIRQKTTQTQTRTKEKSPLRIAQWRPFQVSSSERKPTEPGTNTLFNLVPCDGGLEQLFVKFLDRAPDLAAFAKNTGPQSLRIDYLAEGSRLAFYTADFLARSQSGRHYLVETKGRVDKDVPYKARAAVQWCLSASKKKAPWEFVYVPQRVFEGIRVNRFDELARACEPALKNLLEDKELSAKMPLLATMNHAEEEARGAIKIVKASVLASLPSRYRKAAEEAITLFNFSVSKEDFNLASAFTPLLAPMDDTCRGFVIRKLEPKLPKNRQDAEAWLAPPFSTFTKKEKERYQGLSKNLKKALLYGNPLSPIGLLRNCLDYAAQDTPELGGVFHAIRQTFRTSELSQLLKEVNAINDFRNKWIAHQSDKLVDRKLAKADLNRWIRGLELIGKG